MSTKSPLHATDKRLDTSHGARGLALVKHLCPQCESLTAAPVARIGQGSIGIWCCEGCDFAFDIHVDMKRIDPPRELPRVHSSRRKLAAGSTPEGKHASAQQRLLALHGEELLLRSRLQELADEVAMLKAGDH